MKVKIGDQEFDAQLAAETVTVDGESFNIRIVRHEKTLTVYVNEKPFAVQLPDPLPEDGLIDLLVDAKTYAVEASGAAAAATPRPKAARKSSAAATGAVVSQMTGRIVRIDVETGDEVMPVPERLRPLPRQTKRIDGHPLGPGQPLAVAVREDRREGLLELLGRAPQTHRPGATVVAGSGEADPRLVALKWCPVVPRLVVVHTPEEEPPVAGQAPLDRRIHGRVV